MTAFVKATFAMIHGGFCLPIDPKPISTSEQSWFDLPGSTPETFVETWPELMRPEVVLTGNAVAPHREAVRALATRLCVWKGTSRLDKTLHVFGPRRERRFLPSHFSTLPLVWERTTRGESGTNPVGVKDGQLPNLVDPRNPAAPACYAGRALGWPGREVPSFGRSKTFPPAEVWEWEDSVSVEVFGAAPPDQRVGVLEGDEWIILDGMHAELPRFATRLPKPVATAQLLDDGGRREAIPLVLDTMAIDAANLQVSLLWRGSVAILREHWSEFLVEADLDLGEPDRLDQPLAAPAGIASLGRGLRLKSDPPSSFQPPVPAFAAPPPPPVPAFGAAAPVPAPVAIVPPPPAPPVVSMPITKDEALGASPSRVELATRKGGAGERSEPGVGIDSASMNGPQTLRAAQPMVPASPPAPVPAVVPIVGGPTISTPAPAPAPAPVVRGSTEEPTQTGVRGAILARLTSKQPLTDLNLTGADLSQMNLAEANLSGLNLSGARLVGAVLRGARLSSTKLAGADLSQADLTQADLTQADLSRSTLHEAVLSGAQLLDVNLAGAEGKGARFDKVRAQRAIFAQGKWPKSDFTEADLTGADLSGCELSDAVFQGAILIGSRWVDARATNLTAVGAKLADANLAGASLLSCDFSEAEGPRTVWDRAVLDGTTFRAAKLDASGFARAHLDRTQFVGTSLMKASLMGVTGEAAVFDEANLEAVDLRQGKLLESKFDRARLCKINALKATLANAAMSGADLSGASLRSAKLRGATLKGAVLREADLRDADLEQADLRGSDRQGAKLAGASLKGAVEGESP